MSASQDIVVISDLHLGRGKNPATARYYRLEAFFYDDDFLHFCDHLIDDAGRRDVSFKLILNGDTFDLLRVDHDRGSDQSLRERLYGPSLTPQVATEITSQILRGHPVFVQALAQVLAAGHSVVFLPGNHDIEMQWPPVQDAVRTAIRAALQENASEEVSAQALERLDFRQWFYHEEGRVWIEHGCQYDSENAFQFFLRKDLAERGDAIHKSEVDLPLGTFFQKYLYNKFGNITFLVPNSRSQFRYFRWLLINRPRLLAKVGTVHLPFFWQVLRRIGAGGGKTSELRECHEAELDHMVESDPLGDKLRTIEAYKRIELNAAILAKRAVVRAAKILGYVLLGAVLTTGLWTLGAQSIGTASFNVGFKALLFLCLNFSFLVVTLIVMTYFLLRPSTSGPDPWLAHTANKIAKLLQVSVVTFGHTHDEDVTALSLKAGGWYFNTGTWIAVFTSDSLLPRERVQYTFLRIVGNKGHLMHWSPGRAETMPVVLIDGENEHRERAEAV